MCVVIQSTVFLEYKSCRPHIFFVKDKHERITCTGKYRKKENKVGV